MQYYFGKIFTECALLFKFWGILKIPVAYKIAKGPMIYAGACNSSLYTMFHKKNNPFCFWFSNC